MRPGGYADEQAYRRALEAAGVTVPEQVARGSLEAADQPDATPCGCRLPWWGFRRGYFHLFVLPDGTQYVYERCKLSTEAKREAVKANRLEVARAERDHQRRVSDSEIDVDAI